MAEIDDRTEKGLELASEMLGQDFGKAIRAHITSDAFGASLARLGMSHSYTDCWSREGLDRRSRSLLTIGALVALRQPNELKNHIRVGLANGLTVKELDEALVQLSTYVGFPAVATALSAATEILREIDALPPA